MLSAHPLTCTYPGNPVRIQKYRVSNTIFLDKPNHVLPAFLQVHAEEDYAAIGFPVGFLEPGHFYQAVRAPCGPEIDNDRLSPELAQFNSSSIQCLKPEVRGHFPNCNRLCLICSQIN